jgi:hypothetical protein
MIREKLKDLITIKQKRSTNGDLVILGSLSYTYERKVLRDDLELRRNGIHEITEILKTEILHQFYNDFYKSIKMDFPELYSLIRFVLHERGFNFSLTEDQYYRFEKDKARILLLLDKLSNKLQF